MQELIRTRDLAEARKKKASRRLSNIRQKYGADSKEFKKAQKEYWPIHEEYTERCSAHNASLQDDNAMTVAQRYNWPRRPAGGNKPNLRVFSFSDAFRLPINVCD